MTTGILVGEIWQPHSNIVERLTAGDSIVATWYVKDADGLYGPYSMDELANLVKENRLTPTTLVRRRDSSAWVPAAQLKGIFTAATSPKAAQPHGAPPPLPQRHQAAAQETTSTKSTTSQSRGSGTQAAAAKPAVKVRESVEPTASKFRDAVNSTSKLVRSSPMGMPFYLWAVVASAALFLVVLFVRIIGGGGTTSAPQVAANNSADTERSSGGELKTNDSAPQQVPVKNQTNGNTATDEAQSSSKPSPVAVDRTTDAAKSEKALSTEEIVARTEPSVALIKGSTGSGTGFIVRPGIVVTNKHVVENEILNTLTVHFPSAEVAQQGPFRPTLLYESPDRDIAFLAIDSTLPPLPVAESYVFRRGQEVIVIGSPGLGDQTVLQNAISRGVMSTKTTFDGKEFYQLGISINPGNSGGPAIDMTGKVVGVVTLKASKKEGLGFCIPPDQLLKEMDLVKAVTPESIAKSQSTHRARVVFLRVHAATRIYQVGMEAYTDAMAKALANSVNVNVGLKAVREELEPKLSKIDSYIVADIKRDVTQLGADVHLSDAARQRLIDLWTNYQELKGYVDNPRGTYDSYKTKLLDLSDKHKRASEALRLLLGVELDEAE